MPVPHRARKWWCDAHRDQAAEGDLDDWRAPRIIFTGGGWKVALTSADKAYYGELDRECREEFERREREMLARYGLSARGSFSPVSPEPIPSTPSRSSVEPKRLGRRRT